MASWSDFASSAPLLAVSIRDAIHQYGPGLGYLATVRPDGGPRIHPVSPAVVAGGLYCFLVDSPKRRDLEHNSQYALHAFPPEDSDDEACVRGSASPVTNPRVIRRVAEQLRAEPTVNWWLYELGVDFAMAAERRVGAFAGAASTYQMWVDPVTTRSRSAQVCHA